MAADKNPGMNKLANVLTSRMKKESANAIEAPFDFGVIQSDLSLVTDTYPVPIPNGQYILCRQLTLGKKDEVLTKTQYIGKSSKDGQHPHGPSGEHLQAAGDGIHSHPKTEGAHVHEVLIPEKMASLLPGDRVLVAWVADDAVVIDVVEDS